IDTGGTQPATWQGYSDTSNCVIFRTPLQPPLTCCQKRSRPTPNAETTPMPVITTPGCPLVFICALIIAVGERSTWRRPGVGGRGAVCRFAFVFPVHVRCYVRRNRHRNGDRTGDRERRRPVLGLCASSQPLRTRARPRPGGPRGLPTPRAIGVCLDCKPDAHRRLRALAADSRCGVAG